MVELNSRSLSVHYRHRNAPLIVTNNDVDASMLNVVGARIAKWRGIPSTAIQHSGKQRDGTAPQGSPVPERQRRPTGARSDHSRKSQRQGLKSAARVMSESRQALTSSNPRWGLGDGRIRAGEAGGLACRHFSWHAYPIKVPNEAWLDTWDWDCFATPSGQASQSYFTLRPIVHQCGTSPPVDSCHL